MLETKSWRFINAGREIPRTWWKDRFSGAIYEQSHSTRRTRPEKHLRIPVQPWFLTFIDERQQCKSLSQRVHILLKLSDSSRKVHSAQFNQWGKIFKYRGWGNSTSKNLLQWNNPNTKPPSPPPPIWTLFPSSLCIDSHPFHPDSCSPLACSLLLEHQSSWCYRYRTPRNSQVSSGRL